MKTATNYVGPPANWDRSGLPAWTYYNEELAEIEKDLLFRRHWQLVCHQSDVPKAGDFQCLNMVGERVIVMRGKDGVIRAFHNVCRHRGSRVLAVDQGNCRSAMVCPFHGWSYNLDGTLRSPSKPSSLPNLDRNEFGLKPIEVDVWLGFVFVRVLTGEQPSVVEILAPHYDEAGAYRTETMIPASKKFWSSELDVNWKSVRDVDNEGYHVPIAHPDLRDLYGQKYHDEPTKDGCSRSFGGFNDGPGASWSVRNYKKILPDAPHLPEPNRKGWLYLGLFPNTVIAFYPESVFFYQEFPVSARRTIQRGSGYRYADESRELRLARYLSGRIDRDTGAEDERLIQWSCEATESSGYDGIILSDLEYGVRAYHDALREKIPVMTLDTAPPLNSVARANAEFATVRTVAAE